jgi:hypothetical protein
VDDTQFYSGVRARGVSTFDQAQRVVRARALSDAPTILINDREVLNDLSSLGSAITIERHEGFSTADASGDDDGHVVVLVELNRPADHLLGDAVLPEAHVSVTRDESDGTESVTLSFAGVDPTAERMVNDMLRDISRVVIIRTDR